VSILDKHLDSESLTRWMIMKFEKRIIYTIWNNFGEEGKMIK
jgi:hypothetical protein